MQHTRASSHLNHGGIFIALVGLTFTLIGFMVELEDRQSERIIWAWQALEISSTSNPTASTPIAAPRSNVRQSLEYLNRQFSGRWCHEYVRKISLYFTGNYGRHCIFPRKRRESLRGLNLAGLDLSSVDLRNAILGFTNLHTVRLQDAVLLGATLAFADLSRADLSGANLRGARLSHADLRHADFSGADLDGAVLFRARLSGASFSSADLRHADLSGATGLLCSQLKWAKNWRMARHDLHACK